ncbi:unnamed protein product [Adineta steineri]|uniref:Ig-like domain-containing protein n=1 Tax=Adineta steineri TaxID=433720 RepID=A0A818Q708_9BILA|nr:unnamed protein product [Adineta steineri]
MFLNYRSFSLCSCVLLITFLSSTAQFCSNLTSIDDKDTPCFLEAAINPVPLRTTSGSVVLPCHVARSKRSTIEWWYSDPQKLVNIKIYPVYPPVRPTALRFLSTLTPYSKNFNETDIIDATILLPYVNVDDSGIYRCVIRPWTIDPIERMENFLFADDSKSSSLYYNLQLIAPRLCHSSAGGLPCFTAMRTSSPTVIEAYQTSFLQCVVKTFNRPVSVFWVVGEAPVNSLLINEHLPTNQFNGDRLRRIFPRSLTDYSIELSLNRTTPERMYSCVIDGSSDIETTVFTYIVRNINLEQVHQKILNTTHHDDKHVEHTTPSTDPLLKLLEKSDVTDLDDETSKEEEVSSAEREEEEEEEEVTTPAI